MIDTNIFLLSLLAAIAAGFALCYFSFVKQNQKIFSLAERRLHKRQLAMIARFCKREKKRFPEAKFRIEFHMAGDSLTYVIEVSPLSFCGDDTYNDHEYEFINKFESRYPRYDLCFVSEDSLCQVTNPILEI